MDVELLPECCFDFSYKNIIEYEFAVIVCIATCNMKMKVVSAKLISSPYSV